MHLNIIKRSMAFAGIKWGGALSVEFKTDVEPSVFAKVFDGCKRGRSNRPLYTQEPGELPRRCDTETVYLDRDDMLRIFGKVSMNAVFGNHCSKLSA